MLHGQPRGTPTRLLRRPRIEAMLGASGVTIVSAGAGSGKTATVAAWAHFTGRNGLWIDIGPSTSEASVHAQLATGLRAIGLLPDNGAPQVTEDPRESVLKAIERLESPLLVVFDGVRDAVAPEDRPAWLAEVAARVRRFPKLHVVLLGRSVPSIARSADAFELVTTVTDDDLAYTWTEVAEALAAAEFLGREGVADDPACGAAGVGVGNATFCCHERRLYSADGPRTAWAGTVAPRERPRGETPVGSSDCSSEEGSRRTR